MTIKKTYKKIVVLTMIFNLICLNVGVSFLNFVPTAQATVTVDSQPASLLPSPGSGPSMMIGANSTDVAVIDFTLIQSAGESLSSVTVFLEDVGGSSLTAGDFSHLKIYQDNGDGNFGGGDLLAGSSTLITIGTTTPVTVTTSANNSIAGGGTTFFVTVSTGATWSDSDQDAVVFLMASDAIVTSASSPTITPLNDMNPLVADTTAPTVVSVEYINSNTVDVVFSEMVDMVVATNKDYYSFNGSLSVTEANMQVPNTIRLNSDGDIVVSSTTVAVTASVLDMAGNANITLTPQTVVIPVKVKISEVSANYDGSDNEFVEIYNASATGIDISGWFIQYSADSTVSWTTIATVLGSTTLDAYGFYLFATAGISPTADTPINASMTLSGGHIRIYNGSQEIDKLGWGTASSPEGQAMTVHTQGQSLERKSFGQTWAEDMASGGPDELMGNGWDTQDNLFDFLVQASPAPQNTSSATEEPVFDFFGGNGPMIMHMPINSADTGSDFVVLAQMGDPMTPVDEISAKLYYLVGDGTPENSIVGDYTIAIGSHQTNGVFQFTIPQATVDSSTGDGLYYFLAVVTNGGTGYMSASPTADMSGNIDTVATVPFIVNCAAAGTTYAITGTIQDDTAIGIEAVLVMLEGTGYSTTTDASGDYTINAPNGMYNIFLVKSGYYEESIRDIFVNGAAVSVATKTMFEGTGGGATGDSTKPIILWTGPPDGMFGVPALEEGFEVYIGISKDLDPSTFNASSTYFTIDGTTPIYPSSVEYDNDSSNNMAVFRPMEPYLGVVSAPTGGFLENKTYYLVMTGAIRDTSGNSLEGNRPEGGHVISFTTGMGVDNFVWDDFGSGAMMPPFVIGTKPSDGTLNVDQNTKVTVTFSDSMDSSSVTTVGNIKLNKIIVVSGAEQASSITISTILDTSGKIAIITPASNLVAGKYRLIVSGATKSATGIWMGDPAQSQNVASYEFYKSSFDVGSNVDVDAPTILGTWPINNETGVPVNPGALNIQFSESLDPSTVNSNTITLKRGSSLVTSNVNYDSNSQSVSLTPSTVLATGVDYTLTVIGSSTGITDLSGNTMPASVLVVFTTSSSGDTVAPVLMFANGDDYGIAVTFSEAMQSAPVTDTSNWANSVLNPQNYILKWGDPATVAAAGTVVDLVAANSQFNYKAEDNTVMIENLGLDPATLFLGGPVDFYIDVASTSVAGAGVADLSGNKAGNPTNFQMPINNSMDTKGILGPGDFFMPDMGDMGMMMAGAFPMNPMAGQSTLYFVDVPLTKAVPSGGSIVLTFPSGFDVSSATKDTYSPVNNDINEWNAGVVTIASVTGNQTNRTVTIVTGGDTTQTNDYLHMDITGIINSSIPRGPDTSGYTIDMKTLDASGTLLETINTMPVFINSGGNHSLTVTVNGVTSGHNGQIYVFLASPMTGPSEGIATFNDSTSADVVFSNFPEGQYMLFTEPVATLSGVDYSGMPMPAMIMLNDSSSTTVITLHKEAAGAGVAEITVDITGSFGSDSIDVFAGSPIGFKVKTISPGGENPSATLFLPDGVWMVGMGPAMPKTALMGPPPMPDWMPPMPTEVIISNNGSVIRESSGATNDGTVVMTIGTADKQIIGYVKDGLDTAIADVEVWAYQPMGEGKGAHTKTDTNGKFVLKLSEVGNYSVGVFKPGLPFVPEKSVEMRANTVAVDGNDTADIYLAGNLVTVASPFEIKMSKPSFTISGTVTDGTNPIAYAPVWANSVGSEGHADTMTDSSGAYVLYVDAGTWSVSSYIPGFGDAEAQAVVVSDTDVTQNLAPDSSITYYSISGTVTIGGSAQAYMPIRAVQYDSNGKYTGKEYGGSTGADGTYSISAPGSELYRIDIWTQNYGEVGLNNDGVANNPANVSLATSNLTGKNITIVTDDLNTVEFFFANAVSGQEGFVSIEGVDYSGTDAIPNGFYKSLRISDLSASSSVALADGNYLMFLDVPGLGSYIPDDSSNPDGRNADNEDIVVDGDRWVDFTLPSSITDVVSVSGVVYNTSVDVGNKLADAWVWLGDPTTTFHTGIQTASDGSFSLNVPKGITYKIGADKPGYMSEEPSDLSAFANVAGLELILSPNDNTISGYVYFDTNSNNTYDPGEEIDGAFVRAETSNGSMQSHAPADADGAYEIGVINGTWRVYAMANGYSETEYTSTITISGSSATANIALTADANWENRSKQKPMTPASGGSMDDTGQDGAGKSSGTGIKLTLPPNALGNSTAAGNVNANRTAAVTKTNSSNPIGSQGVSVTATDNSGQAITNLNDYVDVEMVLYKADIEAEIAAGNLTYEQLKVSSNAYWDSTINDWVNLTSTRKAYFKNSGDTEWTLYNNTAASSSFEFFVNSLPGLYDDYKLVFVSKVNHFTVFGTITPTDSVAPSAPSGLAVTASNGSSALNWSDNSESDLLEYQIFRGTSDSFTCNDASQINGSQVASSAYTDSSLSANQSYTYYYKTTAVDNSGNISSCSSAVLANYTYTAPVSTGGNGSVTITYCSDVTYYEWQDTCVNDIQYRNVMSTVPTNCTLTSTQSADRQRACSELETEEEVVVLDTDGDGYSDDEEIANGYDPKTPAEAELLLKISEMPVLDKIATILSEAGDIVKANVNALLGRLGVKRDLAKEQTSVKHYAHKLLKNAKDFSKDNEHALVNFLTYGTETTKYLGEGERAGVINSYKSAFGKLPKTEHDWQDAIKIANGRWPNERNETTEKNAELAFEKIYKRSSDRGNPHDDAAITIISYGLRPSDRNLESEKAGIKSFKAIYGYNPKTATAWDIVRAIAYSGAIR
ncbi:carboxypeptidase regulatory-like domain-containing protein [Candidatus Parcubacteria bacterium]|nr:carboxypeptidase regulatory-like domain-containing protein [Candidatus Parcubacteria bacterium]